jgi:hypothetical protein
MLAMTSPSTGLLQAAAGDHVVVVRWDGSHSKVLRLLGCSALLIILVTDYWAPSCGAPCVTPVKRPTRNGEASEAPKCLRTCAIG